MIIGIVAVGRNNAIGKEGKLPWHYSQDLKFFKERTIGNAVVMGSRTWRSIGKPLPGRLNIVLSRSTRSDVPANVMTLTEPEEVLDLARYLNRDVFIIGGAEVFAAFADHIEKWYVTVVPDEPVDADTFMPSDFLDGFTEASSESLGDGLQVRVMERTKVG